MTRVGIETASAYTSAYLLHKPHLEPSDLTNLSVKSTPRGAFSVYQSFTARDDSGGKKCEGPLVDVLAYGRDDPRD